MAQPFIDELMKVRQAESLLAMVVTIRADFLDDWLRMGLVAEELRYTNV